MSILSWSKKYSIKLIYGYTVESSIDQAMNDFLKAEQLNPNASKGNLFYLAKVNLKNPELFVYQIFKSK